MDDETLQHEEGQSAAGERARWSAPHLAKLEVGPGTLIKQNNTTEGGSFRNFFGS